MSTNSPVVLLRLTFKRSCFTHFSCCLLLSDDQKYVETYTDMATGNTLMRQQQENVGSKKESCMEMDCVDWGIVKTQRIAIVGWMLFGFSYVLESHTWFSLVTFQEGKDYLIIPTIALLAMVAFLQTALIPTSMATRQMTANHQLYGSLLIGGYSVLGVLSLMLQEEHNPTRALAPLGGKDLPEKLNTLLLFVLKAYTFCSLLFCHCFGDIKRSRLHLPFPNCHVAIAYHG